MPILNPGSPLNPSERATNMGPEYIPQQQLRDDRHENDHHDQQRSESICLLEVPLLVKEGGMDRLMEMIGKAGGVVCVCLSLSLYRERERETESLLPSFLAILWFCNCIAVRSRNIDRHSVLIILAIIVFVFQIEKHAQAHFLIPLLCLPMSLPLLLR